MDLIDWKATVRKVKANMNTRRALIPRGYKLEDRHIRYGMLNGLSVETIKNEFEDFKILHRKKGNKYASWYATWQTWVRNYVKYQQKHNPSYATATTVIGKQCNHCGTAGDVRNPVRDMNGTPWCRDCFQRCGDGCKCEGKEMP